MKKSDRALFAGLPELSAEEKHLQTLAALSAVDAGRTIPYEAMEAWAQSPAEPSRRPRRVSEDVRFWPRADLAFDKNEIVIVYHQ